MLCSVFRSSRQLRQIAIPKKPLYRELDPETRKLYQKIIRVDHAGERGAGKGHQKISIERKPGTRKPFRLRIPQPTRNFY